MEKIDFNRNEVMEASYFVFPRLRLPVVFQKAYLTKCYLVLPKCNKRKRKVKIKQFLY